MTRDDFIEHIRAKAELAKWVLRQNVDPWDATKEMSEETKAYLKGEILGYETAMTMAKYID